MDPAERSTNESGVSANESPESMPSGGELPGTSPETAAPAPGAKLDDETSRELDMMMGDLTSEGVEAIYASAEASVPDRKKEGIQRCKVVAVYGDDVFVDVGMKTQGVVPRQQFGHKPPRVGQYVELVVDYYDSESELLVMSREGAVQAANWESLKKGVVVDGRVTGMNKGGLEVDLKGIRAFMPASQVDISHVHDISTFLGERVRCIVTEVNRKEKNVLVSRRKFLEKERAEAREELLAGLAEGHVVTGKVVRITEFGAFVDLGGLDGLLHIKDLSYSRVEKVENVVQVGETVEVKVLRIDPKKERISLGLKQVKPDPWESVEQKYAQGMRVHVRVLSLADFGAFAELEEGIDGLIPISEMSRTKRVRKCSEVVSAGDIVEVEILSVSPKERRISLSIKQLEDDPWRGAGNDFPAEDKVTGKVTRLTDFGAFVELRPGVEGLIHISELSDRRVRNAGEVVRVGQEIEARVLGVDPERRRISLSMKAPSEHESPGAEQGVPASKSRKRKKPLRGGLTWSGIGDLGGLGGLGG